MDLGPDTRKLTNPARVAARTTVAAAQAQGPGKVALWGVSRGDTPVRV